MRGLSGRRDVAAEIDVADLKCLSAAATAAKLAVAASAIGLDGQTIGRGVARLEQSLGARLFDDREQMRLTAAGEAAMVYVSRILDDIEAMRATGQDARRSGRAVPGRRSRGFG